MKEENESINVEKPKITILSNILHDNTIYNIPPFQRNYNWDENNCKELFEDIIQGCKKKENHFIGIIMYYNISGADGNEFGKVLIDGQQRLTTIMLLLCAIRDVSSNTNLKNSINSFIKNSNKKLDKFKLKQNNNDDVNFKCILEGNYPDLKEDSFICKNYSMFIDWLSNYNNKKLIDLFEYIKNLESIEIVLKKDDINNVQKIFEKMNSTGKPLTCADLVRNFVLLTPDINDQNELHTKWICMEEIVHTRNLSKFIRAYTIRYTYKILNKDDVYSKFKEIFCDKSKKSIMDDMLKYACYYSIIENNKYYEYDVNYKPELLDKSNSYIDNTLRLLDALRSDDVVPLIMQLYSVLYKKNEKLLGQILELLLEFMIRYRIVKPSTGGGSLDSKLYDIMKKIEDEKINLTLMNIYKELSKSDSGATSYPSNERFIEKLKSDMNQKNGRVLLYQYARRIKSEVSNEYVFNNKVSLEHLMPQEIKEGTSDGNWWIKHLGKNNYKKIKIDYLDCIGNYGLLSKELNTKVSNNRWPVKREIINKNAIDDTTREATNSINWRKNDIERRNNILSSNIAKIITGPYEENKKNYNWLIKK